MATEISANSGRKPAPGGANPATAARRMSAFAVWCSLPDSNSWSAVENLRSPPRAETARAPGERDRANAGLKGETCGTRFVMED